MDDVRAKQKVLTLEYELNQISQSKSQQKLELEKAKKKAYHFKKES